MQASISHRGILGIGECRALPSLQKFLHDLPEKALILVLCNISNHERSYFSQRNRLCQNDIVVDKTSCDPLYRKSIRVSASATLKVSYTQGTDINDIRAALNDANFHLYALSPSASLLSSK